MVVHANQRDEPGPLDRLLADLPRGRSADYVGLPSSACFESPRDLAATESLRFEGAKNVASKQFLGVIGGRVVEGPRLPDGRANRWVMGGTALGVGCDRHSITLSSSRGGKGRSALITELLTLPAETSVLCLDPKGANARITARWRAEALGQSVGILDPFGVSGGVASRYGCVFNPIELLLRSGRGTFLANARMIADALVLPDGSKELHWTETSKQMIAALCAHVATHSAYAGRRDLISVWEAGGRLATRDPSSPAGFLLEREMTDNDAAEGAVRAAARQFYDRTGGEFSSVCSSVRKSLDWVAYGCMRDVLRGESIDLRDLKRRNVTFYVTLPALRMDALQGWLRLVVQLALAACEEETTLVGNPCVLQLDEFHALGRLNALETAVAQVAGLGAKLHIALQNLSQLSPYGKNYETFLANAGVIRVLGCADNTSLEYLSKALGSALVLSRSTSSPTFEQAARQAASGESWSLTNHPLMTAEEIGRYFARNDKLLRQLILRPGYRPMVIQRAYYDKHELFRGRYDD